MAQSEERICSDDAIAMVRFWLKEVGHKETQEQKKALERLRAVIVDQSSLHFVMHFVDRVVRPDKHNVSAIQFHRIVNDRGAPGFLSAVDKALLRLGATLAPLIPPIVMPLAKGRMRSIVGHLIAPAEPGKLENHLSSKRGQGFAVNVNLLGEAVLGEREANRRFKELLEMIKEPGVDYVSVKISAVASQLNHWAYDDSLRRVSEKLFQLVSLAANQKPVTFINFDMEEYHDLDLTLDAFKRVLGRQECHGLSAGIVLQAYLPDAYEALKDLVAWANDRHQQGGGDIKIRLVKGANLAMEKVDAALHGWKQAPYSSKVETDANYKRCLNWLLTEDRMQGVRLGLASHNLFDIAWTHLLSKTRGVESKIQFEMLQGMAPAHANAVASTTSPSGNSMLLYTPAVKSEDFDVAISYLFRRLEENASDENFLRHLFELATSDKAFNSQRDVFLKSLSLMETVVSTPRRTQDRNATSHGAYRIGESFVNEPETDTVLTANRAWIKKLSSQSSTGVVHGKSESTGGVDVFLGQARQAQKEWQQVSASKRQQTLHRLADEIASSRDEIFVTMRDEANKTFAEADAEICEAIDFARYYGDRAKDFESNHAMTFDPFGVVGVIPPWNFPFAIPCGGVFAALASGNSVLLKPAPQTPRTAELIDDICKRADLPLHLVQYLRTPENHVGKHLITSVDAVILTGASDTAKLFQRWKPSIRLFAETSGKNALVITPNADIDLAVSDLVKSAFGHGGQKCSAASLALLVGDVYESPRFRRQLVDAVESIEVGFTQDIETSLGPLIEEPSTRLRRGLQQLDDGESWLVKPRCISKEKHLWSPGVKVGVQKGSWFHQNECFGPVLGLMKAKSLEDALDIQNSSEYGLTGGIHSLDPNEIETWRETVQVGNAYINRPITGAIVQRQPFGGWKKSAVGPGAKAGGPNYLYQLGSWSDVVDIKENYQDVWSGYFSQEHDPTNLFCESNILRYVPLDGVLLRVGPQSKAEQIARAKRAMSVCGVKWFEEDESTELQTCFGRNRFERVRYVGVEPSEESRCWANENGIYLDLSKVVAEGRIELLKYLKEQAISKTLHRFGNLVL